MRRKVVLSVYNREVLCHAKILSLFPRQILDQRFISIIVDFIDGHSM